MTPTSKSQGKSSSKSLGKASSAPKLPAPKIPHIFGERGAGGSGLEKRAE